MSGVTRYDKLDLDAIQYDKPENTGSVYFGSISYKSSPLLVQSSRLIVKEIKKDEKHTTKSNSNKTKIDYRTIQIGQ